MKAKRESFRTAGVTPESAVWMLYAGLCEGLRWQRHAVKVASDAVRPAFARPRARGPRS